MDVLLMIVYVSIVLGVLVIIHEGGHFLAARAFGVRVTEFMVGFPGPGISVRHGETRFGVTCVPLGGYARICGMEPGEMSPFLQLTLACAYDRGTLEPADVMRECGATEEQAYAALDELVEWGCLVAPKKSDETDTYRLVDVRPTKRQIRRAQKAGLPVPQAYDEGQPRPYEDAGSLFESEYKQQYRSLPFWKRSVIVLAGIVVNLLFAMAAFIVVYSCFGFDIQNTQTGEITHVALNPLKSIQVGFSYIGMVAQAIIELFNPATAVNTIQNSSSIVGIAIVSKTAAEQGLSTFLLFMAMISVSLGLMNLLPIPPLDGGRFVVEVYQKIARRVASERVMNALSFVGMGFIVLLFVVMVGQDVLRIFDGFY